MDELDPISVIEAAYRMGVNDKAWMTGILEVVRPAWDDGLGVGMFEVGLDDQGRPRVGTTAFDSDRPELFEETMRGMNAELDDDQIEHSYKRPMIHATLSERMAQVTPDFRDDPVYRKFAHPHGMQDFLAVQIADPSGTMLVMGAPLRELATTTEAQRHRWQRLAAHIAAAYRLRRQMGEPISSEEHDVDDAAVLSTDGTVTHVADDDLSQDSSSLDQLELAAEAIGRARGEMRRSAPVAAVDLWRALAAARYSLIEHVDTDGKKTWRARPNEPAPHRLPHMSAHQLSARERQVVQLAAMGHPERLISYEIGLPLPTVRRLLQSGLDKLELDSPVELIKVWESLRHNGPT